MKTALIRHVAALAVAGFGGPGGSAALHGSIFLLQPPYLKLTVAPRIYYFFISLLHCFNLWDLIKLVTTVFSLVSSCY